MSWHSFSFFAHAAESDGWHEENGRWYFVENGERVTVQWREDSQGWCYLKPDGRILRDGYASDSSGSHYIDQTGHMAEPGADNNQGEAVTPMGNHEYGSEEQDMLNRINALRASLGKNLLHGKKNYMLVLK